MLFFYHAGKYILKYKHDRGATTKSTCFSKAMEVAKGVVAEGLKGRLTLQYSG